MFTEKKNISISTSLISLSESIAVLSDVEPWTSLRGPCSTISELVWNNVGGVMI